jgi:glycosyltransferase involved in cell wall biosynthesis
MKICMFTNTYWPHVGGVARSVRFFAEDLIDRGHRVLIVAPEYAGERETSGHRPEILRVPAIQNFNGSDFSVRIPLPLYIDQEIEKFLPDIVHSHHPFLLGDSAVRAARKRALPLVFTHHTLYEDYTHYVPLDSDVMKSFVIGLSTMYANLCTHVVAPSASIARLLKERGVVTPIADIPTGVDISFFTAGDGDRLRRMTELPKNAFVIGHLGRLAPEKNLTYLSEAVANFLENTPTAHFIVVGKGPSRTEIQRIFAERNLEGRLHLVGEATGDQLRDAYRAMDVFVFSSKSETQGMVLVEAMAAGKPVVALDAPGSREVVQDGGNGRLLRAGASIADFAAALRECHSVPSRLKKWASGARATAKRFSRETIARKMEKLYKTALDGNTSPLPETSIDLGPLDTIAERIKTEWELWSRKTAAVLEAAKAHTDSG